MQFVSLLTLMLALVWADLRTATAADDIPNRTIDPNAPMSFEYTGNGGNIKGSDWIAAEGIITADTPSRFKEFLAKTVARNTFVKFNSPGGNLVAAIKLGEMIRAAHLDTSVGRTVFNKDGSMWSGEMSGSCLSGCAYAFLGGEMRIVGENEIGVHQFYDSKALDEPQQKAFSAIDISIEQMLAGLVIDYVLHMGAEVGLVSLAEATPPWEMHYLTLDELLKLRVTNANFLDAGWKIEPRSGGAVLILTSTYSNRPPVTMAMVCRRGKAGAQLVITSPMAYLDHWLAEGYGAQHPLTALEIGKSLNGFQISGRGWTERLDVNSVVNLGIDGGRIITLVVELSPKLVAHIRGGGLMTFSPDFPVEFAGFLYVETKSNLSSAALDLVLRNCTL